MLGSPESPGYLASKGKRDEAVAVATKLWGPKGVAQLGESAGASNSSRSSSVTSSGTGNKRLLCHALHTTYASCQAA